MTEELKEKCRELIENEGWHRIGIIDPNPSPLLWNKNVKLMYENMDGRPCVCTALYYHDERRNYFEAVSGPAKGNKMCNLIAFKEIGK